MKAHMFSILLSITIFFVVFNILWSLSGLEPSLFLFFLLLALYFAKLAYVAKVDRKRLRYAIIRNALIWMILIFAVLLLVEFPTDLPYNATIFEKSMYYITLAIMVLIPPLGLALSLQGFKEFKNKKTLFSIFASSYFVFNLLLVVYAILANVY